MAEQQLTQANRSELGEQAFAEALRAFLTEHHPGRTPREPSARLAFLRAWQATLVDEGWIAPGWPRRWGGMDLPARLQAVYHREMARGRAPVPPTNAVSFLTAPGDFTDLVAGAIEGATGRRPALSTTGGTSDARFIKNYCPVVEFGLVGQTMHKIDECASVEDITALSEIYEDILSRYFGVG